MSNETRWAMDSLGIAVSSLERAAGHFPEDAQLAALASDAREQLARYAERYALERRAAAPRNVRERNAETLEAVRSSVPVRPPRGAPGYVRGFLERTDALYAESRKLLGK